MFINARLLPSQNRAYVFSSLFAYILFHYIQFPYFIIVKESINPIPARDTRFWSPAAAAFFSTYYQRKYFITDDNGAGRGGGVVWLREFHEIPFKLKLARARVNEITSESKHHGANICNCVAGAATYLINSCSAIKAALTPSFDLILDDVVVVHTGLAE